MARSRRTRRTPAPPGGVSGSVTGSVEGDRQFTDWKMQRAHFLARNDRRPARDTGVVSGLSGLPATKAVTAGAKLVKDPTLQ